MSLLILTAGHQRITLIEGDPGAGKTTIANNICKRWAEGELLTKELVFLVPLCDIYYQKVTNLNELFDKLGCPEMKDYAQQNSGEGLLDGWDELPRNLRSQSFFYEIIFTFKNIALTCSTFIVTSLPSCSHSIAEVVGSYHYQILGFAPRIVKTYIEEYFRDNQQNIRSLLSILDRSVHLRAHFYIPITVVIMCFVYHKSGNQLPKTLPKIYEKFVLLCVYCNDPENRKFKGLLEMPKESWFSKLCQIAYTMLNNNKLMFNEEQLEDDLKCASPDGFGLLSIENVTNEFGRHYSFIHRAVQGLLAAVSIVGVDIVESTFNKHFHESSYLIDMFPFVFGLMSEKHREFLAEKLQQKFVESHSHYRSMILGTILHCLFEGHDAKLCCGFGQVFNDKPIIVYTKVTLWYHHVAYFLSTCGCKSLDVDGLLITDTSIEAIAQYLCSNSSDVIIMN